MVAELEPYRDYILTGNEAALLRKPSTAGLAGGADEQPPSAPGRSVAAAASSHGDAATDATGSGAVAS